MLNPFLKKNSDHYGMNLRDYLAAHVDIPWNSILETLKLKGVNENEITIKMVVEYRAELKYIEADAMIKERTKNLDK